MNSVLAVLLVIPLAVVAGPKKDQKIVVSGQLLCDGAAMVGYDILLREHDTVDPDDTLNTTKSGWQGFFTVIGHENEVFKITPYIRVKHDCEVSKPDCYRLSDYYVPKHGVERGSYNFGELNLQIHGETDEEHCD